MKPAFLRNYKQSLLFLAGPLLLELLVYLRRPEIFPAYLTAGALLANIGLSLLYFFLLFALVSLLPALLFVYIRARVEDALAALLFTIYLAMTSARLLPFDSGLSIARLIVFGLSLAIGIFFFLLLHRKQLEITKLFVAHLIFCGFAAGMLVHLFSPPLEHVVYVFLLYPPVFAALLFLPGKAVVAVLVFAFVLQSQTRTTIPAFAPPVKLPPYHRVILIGVDALSPDVVFEMAKNGKLPAFQRLIQNGVYGRLHTLPVPFSPLVWNTIYTGTTPRRHGIMGFTHTKIAGATPFVSLWLDNWSNSDWMHLSVNALHSAGLVQAVSPVTSRDRLEPAIWNMVDQNEAPSVVVGGWTTYPPEMIRGSYVSDYAATAQNPLGTYYPVAPQIQELLAYKPDVSAAPDEIRRYVFRDSRIHHIASSLFKTAPPETRFFFTYFSSIDAYGHHYGRLLNMKSTPEQERARLSSMRDDVYTTIDRYLNDYLQMMDDDTLLIVCSDHGFRFDKRQHNYSVDGTILLLGKNVRKNLMVEAGVYNIAPTIAYALGIAPSARFESLPLKQAFEGSIPEAPAREYRRNTAFFERPGQEGLDEEKMQELIDLQYVNRGAVKH